MFLVHPSGHYPSDFLTEVFYTYIYRITPMRDLCPANICLQLITVIIFGEKCKLQIFLSCSIPCPSVS
jgi:hypothetical protein